MTPVRRIVKGQTQLLSRRCSERRFFLKPSKPTAGIFLYALAHYAKRYAARDLAARSVHSGQFPHESWVWSETTTTLQPPSFATTK